MNALSKRLLYWSPRVLCLLFAAFISLFALDVFEGGFQGWRTLAALGMHLIPTALLLAVLALAWRWEWVGGVAFAALGLFYIAWSWGRFGWVAPVVIGGVPLLLAALFAAGWILRGQLRPRPA